MDRTFQVQSTTREICLVLLSTRERNHGFPETGLHLWESDLSIVPVDPVAGLLPLACNLAAMSDPFAPLVHVRQLLARQLPGSPIYAFLFPDL